jgi:hypothetical protein
MYEREKLRSAKKEGEKLRSAKIQGARKCERKSVKFKAKKRARKRKREELPPGARQRKCEA